MKKRTAHKHTLTLSARLANTLHHLHAILLYSHQHLLPTRSALYHDDPSHMPYRMELHCPKEIQNQHYMLHIMHTNFITNVYYIVVVTKTFTFFIEPLEPHSYKVTVHSHDKLISLTSSVHFNAYK